MKGLQRSARVVLPLFGAFCVICAVIGGLGANPFVVLADMATGALGTQFYVSETLMVMAPLVLCGLAAAIPFSARLWNIGGTGQLLMGAIVSVLIALTVGRGIPGPLLAAVCLLAGIGAGAAWALVAGALKVGVGGNEVIVTLMLNLVAIDFADYVITGPWAQGAAPQTRSIPSGATFGSFWQNGFNETVLIAVAVAGLAAVLMGYTRTGFGIRAAGRNLEASRLAGFSSHRLWLSAFALGGAAAGLAGALLVVGVHSALVPNINEQYGYTGVAISLIAGLRPLLIIPAGFLFAIIEVGGSGLSASAHIPTSITYVIEGVIVIALLAFRAIRVRT